MFFHSFAILAAVAGTALAENRHDQATAQPALSIDTAANQVAFFVSAAKGLKLNFDGPWKLEVSGLATTKGNPAMFGKADLDQADQKFVVTLKEALTPKSPKGKYTLTYFLCNDPTTWCKRGTLTGEVPSLKP